MAVSEATEEAEGGYLGSLHRSLNYREPTEVSDNFGRLAERLSQAGASSGESGKKRLIDGKEPRTIELAIRERINAAHYSYDGYSLPIIAKTYEPRIPTG